MRVRVNGLEKLLKQVNALPQAVIDGSSNAANELTEIIRDKARDNVSTNSQHPTGTLENSIQNAVKNDGDVILASVFSDERHSVFMEFGTGPNGASSSKKLPPNVSPVYRSTPWFFHESQADRDLNALYGMPMITIGGQNFYFTHGVIARPFLYPAFLEGVENAEEIFKNNISKSIRGVIR